MALGIRDYYLFISYLDFKVRVEQGLSYVCVCIITMSRARFHAGFYVCQGFTHHLARLLSPWSLYPEELSHFSLAVPFPVEAYFPRKLFSMSPKLFQSLHYTSDLPPPQASLHLSSDAFPIPPTVLAAEAGLFSLPPGGEWGLTRRLLCRRCFFATVSRKFLPKPV